MPRSLLLAALPLVACSAIDVDPDLEASAHQLESVAVHHDADWAAGEAQDIFLDGVLAVSGSDADWTIEVVQRGSEDSVTLATLQVHDPGRADLSVLDGFEGTVALMPDWFGEAWSVAALDGQGAAWFLDLGLHLDEAEAIFGQGFLRLGEEIGHDSDETWDTSYRGLVLQADDGERVVEPGEVVEVVLGGVRYRFTAISAWVRQAQPDAALPGCPTAEELLAYELVRVEEPVEEDVLVRPGGEPVATVGCL